MAARPAPVRSRLAGASPIAPPPETPAPAQETPTSPTTTDPAAPTAPPANEPAAKPLDQEPPAPKPATVPTTARSTRAASTGKKGTVPDRDARKWDEYEAKTARLRPDQRIELTTIARQLTVAKKGAGEKITDNTLIRVAVDILLAEAPMLLEPHEDGPLTTEQQIRMRLGLTT